MLGKSLLKLKKRNSTKSCDDLNLRDAGLNTDAAFLAKSRSTVDFVIDEEKVFQSKAESKARRRRYYSDDEGRHHSDDNLKATINEEEPPELTQQPQEGHPEIQQQQGQPCDIHDLENPDETIKQLQERVLELEFSVSNLTDVLQHRLLQVDYSSSSDYRLQQCGNMAVVGAIGAIGTFILGTAWEIIAEKTLEEISAGIGKRLTGDEDTEDFIRQQLMEKTYETRESLLTLQQQELKTAYTFLENGYVLYFADPDASKKDFAKAREFATTSFEALDTTADKIRAVKVSIIASMHEFDGNLDATYRLCTNYLRKMNYMAQTREAVRIHLGLDGGPPLTAEELAENKATIKKVMDINKCVAAFLAEQEPNETQVLQNWPVIEYLPGKKIHPVTEFHKLQGISQNCHSSKVTSIIMADDILVTGSSQEGISVWHPQTLQHLASGKLDNEMKVFSLAVFEDRIFSGLEDGSIVVWRLDADYNLLKEQILNAHESTVWSLIVNGDILYSGSQDKCVTVWELCSEEMECSETIVLPHWIQTLKFYSDKLLLARGDDKISFIHGQTGAVQTEEGFGAGDALTLNDQFLFTSRGSKIDVFRINYPLDGCLSKEFFLTLDLHEKRVVRLSLCGDFIVSAAYDGFVRVWDIDSFKCRTAVNLGHCGIWSLHTDKQTETQFVKNVYAGCKDGTVVMVPIGHKATSFSSKFSRLSSSKEHRRPSISPLSPSVLNNPRGAQLALPGPHMASHAPATPCIASMAPKSMMPNQFPSRQPMFALAAPKAQNRGPNIRPLNASSGAALEPSPKSNQKLAIPLCAATGRTSPATPASPTPAAAATVPASPRPAPVTPSIRTVPPTPPVLPSCSCVREHIPGCPLGSTAPVSAPRSPAASFRLPPKKDPRGAPRPVDESDAAAVQMLKLYMSNPQLTEEKEEENPNKSKTPPKGGSLKKKNSKKEAKKEEDNKFFKFFK